MFVVCAQAAFGIAICMRVIPALAVFGLGIFVPIIIRLDILDQAVFLGPPRRHLIAEPTVFRKLLRCYFWPHAIHRILHWYCAFMWWRPGFTDTVVVGRVIISR